MVSLKLSKKEAKAETIEAREVEAPEYPYGLSLYLEDDTIGKLGLSADMKAGTEITFTAKAKVTGYSLNSYAGGDHQSLSLQVTDMEVEDPDEEKEGLADRMYKNPPKASPYGK